MSDPNPSSVGEGSFNRRLAILLAHGHVRPRGRHDVDERLDLGGGRRPQYHRQHAVQAAIALEALVSAAFILISSKIGDLIGRKRAYVLGLLGYTIGALTMTLTDSLAPMIIFWAILGGLRSIPVASGDAVADPRQFRRRCSEAGLRPRRGASAAIAAAFGPLLGGFVTTYMSWRVGSLLEVVIIAIVLLGMGMVRDVPYTGDRRLDLVGAVLSIVGMGGVVLGILVWQEGGEAVGILIAVGIIGLLLLARWLVRRKREGKVTLLDPDLLKSKMFRLGITGQMLQQIALGGSMIVIPIFLQMVLGYNAMQTGLTLAPLSLTMFAVSVRAGKRAGKRRPAAVIRAGFGLLTLGIIVMIPIVPRTDTGWWLAIPLFIMGMGLGLVVSQLNNYALGPDIRGANQ